ncbi:hypothetical protein CVT25_014683 [Psilocybe cyanescens]|uniref:Uncharacterized protein n=1 Tax=Psilocybe cyanescens TaxID=93625 RepID=A0A409WTU5_PSICY|nr:hypothetical protein CVT25_014683 [Psilocybe cyanescens]
MLSSGRSHYLALNRALEEEEEEWEEEAEEAEEGYTLFSSSPIDSDAPKVEAQWETCSHSYPPNVCRREMVCERNSELAVGRTVYQHNSQRALHGEKRDTRRQTKALQPALDLFTTLGLDILLGSFVFHFRNFFTPSYELLSSSKAILHAEPTKTHLCRRRSWRRLAVISLLALTVGLISTPVLLGVLVLMYGGMPPSYADARFRERMLPQHRWGRDGMQSAGGLVRGNGYYYNGGRNGTTRGEEGEERYLRFPDHLWGHGLNNVLQEALLYALLAHHANRSYVFEDFVWSHLPLPYTLYDFTLRPTRVPMGAFLGGWIVGQSQSRGDTPVKEIEWEDQEGRPSGPLIARVLDFSKWARAQFAFQPEHRQTQVRDGLRTTTTTTGHAAGDVFKASSRADTGRAHAIANGGVAVLPETRTGPPRLIRSSISAEYFEHVCPPSKYIEVFYSWPSDASISPEPGDLGGDDDRVDRAPEATADGINILRWWVDRLAREDVRDQRCVVIREQDRRVWDSDFFGTRRPLSLFPILRDSPALRAFEWSALVKGAVDRTIAGFFTQLPRNAISEQNTLAKLSQTALRGDKPTRTRIVSTASVGVGTTVSNEDSPVRPAKMIDDTDAAALGGSGAPAGFVSFGNFLGADDNATATADVNKNVDENGGVQMMPGVLAVHLRRGDYKRHCLRLADWGAGYMGWNRLIEAGAGVNGSIEGAGGEVGFEDGLWDYLMRSDMSKMRDRGEGEDDSDDGVAGDTSGLDTDLALELVAESEKNSGEMREQLRKRRTEAYYLAHCLPTIPQIVRRLREVREEYEGLFVAEPTPRKNHVTDPRQYLESTATTNTPSADSKSKNATGADADHRYSLREVYVLTNGWPSFVDELRGTLLRDGWEKVVGSTDVERGEFQGLAKGHGQRQGDLGLGRDRRGNDVRHHHRYNWLVEGPNVMTMGDSGEGDGEETGCPVDVGLSKEEKGVSAAIDMGLAERAEVFVGNGVSVSYIL